MAAAGVDDSTSDSDGLHGARTDGTRDAGPEGGFFRLCGSTWLLTYPHCPLAPGLVEREVIAGFQELGMTINRTVCRRELHADGNEHVHCGVQVTTRVNRRIQAYTFDLFDHITQKNYHPNIRGAKRGERWEQLYAYVTKEDEEVQQQSAKKGRLVAGMDHTDGATYLADLRELEPMLFFKHHSQALAVAEFIDTEHGRHEPVLAPMVFNRVPIQMSSWVERVLLGPKDDRYVALMVIGGTRTGKTSWARRLLPPSEVAYMKGMWDAGAYHKKAKMWLIDDCDHGFPLEHLKTIVNGTEGTVTDKYRRKLRVHAMPCLWICNEKPRWLEENEAYWAPNIEVVNLTQALWGAEDEVIPPEVERLREAARTQAVDLSWMDDGFVLPG